MEETNFKNRVDKVFGSLFPSTPYSSTHSPWSLSDDTLHHVRWTRPQRPLDDHSPARRSHTLLPNGKLHRHRTRLTDFEGDLNDHDGEEDDDDDDDDVTCRIDPALDDEDQIRACIGFDTALDREEEEDEFDKVAVGREGSTERSFMGHVADYGPQINFHDQLPGSIEIVKYVDRDPRANHFAASTRQKEDKDTVEAPIRHQPSEDGTHLMVDSLDAANGGKVKSILKRKLLDQTESKPQKRVRFSSDCKVSEREESHDFMITEKTEGLDAPEPQWLVPDYLRNPSKCRCYTFDPTEDDDASNVEAYRNFCALIGKSSSNSLELERPVKLPSSIQFTPKKKVMGDSTLTNGTSSQLLTDYVREPSCSAVSMAALQQEDSEVCAMEEDEVEKVDALKSRGSRRLGRHYRSKPFPDD